MAEALGRPEKSIVPLDRAAAEAGLRTSTGGRGNSAPKMTQVDATALLLMVLTHTSDVSANVTAARVQDMQKYTWSTKRGDLALPLPDLVKGSFGLSMTNLIAHGSDLERWLNGGSKGQRHFQLSVDVPDCTPEIAFSQWHDEDMGRDFQEIEFYGVHDKTVSPVKTRRYIDATPLLQVSKHFRS
jgi:hypothetical protein